MKSKLQKFVEDELTIVRYENKIVGHFQTFPQIEFSSEEMTENIFENETALSKIKDKLVDLVCDTLYGDIKEAFKKVHESVIKYNFEKKSVYALNELRRFRELEKSVEELQELIP